jgi:hypothetical protein
LNVLLIVVYVYIIINLILTIAASAIVFLRTRKSTGLKYIIILASLNTIEHFVLVTVFVLSAVNSVAPNDVIRFVDLGLIMLSFQVGTIGWTLMAFYTSGIINGAYPETNTARKDRVSEALQHEATESLETSAGDRSTFLDAPTVYKKPPTP